MVEREKIWVDKEVYGGDWEGGEEVGEVLDQAVFTWLAWFGYEGKWGGLEWAKNVLDLSLGKGAKVPTLGEFFIYDVVEN